MGLFDSAVESVIGNSGEGEAESTQQSQEIAPQGASHEQESEAPSITDISKLEKFLFDGKELTPQELKQSILRQADYTRKTQELAQQRESYEKEKLFSEKISIDLEEVRKDPSLVQAFKQTYPEKYHKLLDLVLGPQQQAQGQNQPQVPKELLSRLERVESTFREREVAAIEADLDVKFSKLSAKYPRADEEKVITRASLMLNQGEELTDAKWESLFKSAHEAQLKAYQDWQKQQVTEQKQANAKGKDIAPGGGIPGQAPKRMSLKEAMAMAVQNAEKSALR